MRVLFDAMMALAGLVHRVDVDHHERQVIQMVKELVADLGGDCVGLRNCQSRIHCDVDLGVQPVTKPARPHLGDLLYLRYVLGGVSNFLDYLRIGAVEHPEKN